MEMERLIESIKEKSKMGNIIHDKLEELKILIEIVGLNQVFKNILVVYIPQFSLEYTCPVDVIKPTSQLKTIATMLFGFKLGNHCSQMFITLHKEALEDSLADLGGRSLGTHGIYKSSTRKSKSILLNAFDRLGGKLMGRSKQEDEKEHVEWETMKNNVEDWKRALFIFVKINLIAEKRFCDEIFEPNHSVSCFYEISFDCMMHVLRFAEAIAEGQQLEKLIMILEVYEVLVDLTPYIEYLYPRDDDTQLLRPTFQKVFEQVGNNATKNFVKFKNMAPCVTTIAPPMGRVHSSTVYIMGVLRTLVDHHITLNTLLTSECTSSSRIADEIHSPMAVHVRSLISTLKANLELSSSNQGRGLLEIVMITNMHYITEEVNESKLQTVLGQQWMVKERGEIKRYAGNYFKSVWNPVLDFLDTGCLRIQTPNPVTIKEQLKNFYNIFGKIYETQTGWLIDDRKLRDDMRIQVSTFICQVYVNFKEQMMARKINNRYLKYTLYEIDNFIFELFEGSAKQFKSR